MAHLYNLHVHIIYPYMYILPYTNRLYVRSMFSTIQSFFARPDLVARTTEDAGVEVEVDAAVALEVQVEWLLQ